VLRDTYALASAFSATRLPTTPGTARIDTDFPMLTVVVLKFAGRRCAGRCGRS
jgi:hypothetical protein